MTFLVIGVLLVKTTSASPMRAMASASTELCTLIYSLILAMNKPCMVLTTLNVVGAAATTVIVAKTENEFDAKVYNS